MAYTELIKNFNRIRDYMREFYVYGFKSREDYSKKSARSYDNERRRIESYLGGYMSFRRTSEGKNIFLSIDSRASGQNPLYKAFKCKSFTDGDITLHFILFDILSSPNICLTIPEITKKVDEYLSNFSEPMLIDESTIRKKLKEYTELGLIENEKRGRQLCFKRSSGAYDPVWSETVAYFAEAGLCGVIGSYLLDKTDEENNIFSFKHHYITHALENEILCNLFMAISEHRKVTITNYTRNIDEEKVWEVVPLKIFVSVQSGRRYLLAYSVKLHKINSYRLDYITEVQQGEAAINFDSLRRKLEEIEPHMWGVSCNRRLSQLEHVEFTIHIEDWEPYIWKRLEREGRCGTIEKIDKNTAKFSADLSEIWEIIPWIRTFICRIVDLNFSNRTVENQFKKDLEDMYASYVLGEVTGNDIP